LILRDAKTEAKQAPNTAILLVSCPDRRGLVAAIANFLYTHGANILHADQHQDAGAGLFFMRVEWDLDGFDLDDAALRAAFTPVARALAMEWRIEYSAARPAVAIFVSRYQHCAADLLHRFHAGEMAGRVALVAGNHPDAQAITQFYGVPFHHVPVEPRDKAAAEARQAELIEACGVKLIVLARYMQVLSPPFVARYPRRIINVHHSFLPAFSGARPHRAAFQRGVKLIGATSHYVTDVLDDGPIIEQDVTRVSHRDSLRDFIQKSGDLERVVLARAVRWHLEHRILCYGNRSVVFD
jgi:formyltetrahydrofolate deformylase